MADLAERRRSQTELRIALWTLVLTVVTASALVSRWPLAEPPHGAPAPRQP